MSAAQTFGEIQRAIDDVEHLAKEFQASLHVPAATSRRYSKLRRLYEGVVKLVGLFDKYMLEMKQEKP